MLIRRFFEDTSCHSEKSNILTFTLLSPSPCLVFGKSTGHGNKLPLHQSQWIDADWGKHRYRSHSWWGNGLNLFYHPLSNRSPPFRDLSAFVCPAWFPSCFCPHRFIGNTTDSLHDHAPSAHPKSAVLPQAIGAQAGVLSRRQKARPSTIQNTCVRHYLFNSLPKMI